MLPEDREEFGPAPQRRGSGWYNAWLADADALKAGRIPDTPLGRPAYRTRRRRVFRERPARLNKRLMPTRSLESAIDPFLTDGAARCLDILASLPRGGRERFQVRTNRGALAKHLMRTPRTVSTYLKLLEM